MSTPGHLNSLGTPLDADSRDPINMMARLELVHGPAQFARNGLQPLSVDNHFTVQQ
jgi:hypothetical protein